jgi:hypothetical protein
MGEINNNKVTKNDFKKKYVEEIKANVNNLSYKKPRDIIRKINKDFEEKKNK